jgi:hypothetical protein
MSNYYVKRSGYSVSFSTMLLSNTSTGLPVTNFQNSGNDITNLYANNVCMFALPNSTYYFKNGIDICNYFQAPYTSYFSGNGGNIYIPANCYSVNIQIVGGGASGTPNTNTSIHDSFSGASAGFIAVNIPCSPTQTLNYSVANQPNPNSPIGDSTTVTLNGYNITAGGGGIPYSGSTSHPAGKCSNPQNATVLFGGNCVGTDGLLSWDNTGQVGAINGISNFPSNTPYFNYSFLNLWGKGGNGASFGNNDQTAGTGGFFEVRFLY